MGSHLEFLQTKILNEDKGIVNQVIKILKIVVMKLPIPLNLKIQKAI